jgi:hypothetical protein
MCAMTFRVLADATVLLHGAFVVFVLLGGLLVLRRPRTAWVHLPAVAWGAWVEFAGLVCPLTPLENWLRAHGDGAGYTTGFIEHYLVPVLYPASLSRDLQWGLGSLVLLVNAVMYILVLRRRASHQLVQESHGTTRPDLHRSALPGLARGTHRPAARPR